MVTGGHQRSTSSLSELNRDGVSLQEGSRRQPTKGLATVRTGVNRGMRKPGVVPDPGSRAVPRGREPMSRVRCFIPSRHRGLLAAEGSHE